jgi:hypothetical protein
MEVVEDDTRFFVTAERLLEHCIFIATSRGPRVRLVLGSNPTCTLQTPSNGGRSSTRGDV